MALPIETTINAAAKLMPELDRLRKEALLVGNKRASEQALRFGMAHDIILLLVDHIRNQEDNI